MQTQAPAVVQLVLPFEGLQDRIRNAAECGRVAIGRQARGHLKDYGIPDILVIRALKLGELHGKATRGKHKGEWQCVVTFSARGFRPGGYIAATLSEGRIFVTSFIWDNDNV
nr:hypothetical protein [uncultured organism]